MLSRALILLFLSAAAFPRGGLCGGREEAAAKGCTLGLLIERFNESEKALAAYALAHPPSGKWGGGETGRISASCSTAWRNWATGRRSRSSKRRV